jgi:hypothetical protein
MGRSKVVPDPCPWSSKPDLAFLRVLRCRATAPVCLVAPPRPFTGWQRVYQRIAHGSTFPDGASAQTYHALSLPAAGGSHRVRLRHAVGRGLRVSFHQRLRSPRVARSGRCIRSSLRAEVPHPSLNRGRHSCGRANGSRA